MLTQEELKARLHYNPETGIFTWLDPDSHRVSKGDTAGGPTGNGYLRIGINGKRYKAHRLAWLYVHGVFPPELVDHKNRVKTDNRISNLRPASYSQNSHNSSGARINAWGCTGVYFSKGSRKWGVAVSNSNTRKYLGLFSDLDAARQAYLSEAKILHGDFFPISDTI